LAVITKHLAPLVKLPPRAWTAYGLGLLEIVSVFEFGRQTGLWWLACVIVGLVELRPLVRNLDMRTQRTKDLIWERLPGLFMGLSAVLITALVPRQVTQVSVALLYGMWLLWRERSKDEMSKSLVQLLLVQGVVFEAIFLMAAIWQVPTWFILGLVWGAAYTGVYGVLRQRSDRSAGVMAATWGVIATEVSWVLMLWLITYTMRGGYILVPQPALILTALTYVFGSILSSSRQGNLSRARLAEYMVIGLVLVVIVVSGTSWRGNV
jgi:hypothetical protein